MSPTTQFLSFPLRPFTYSRWDELREGHKWREREVSPVLFLSPPLSLLPKPKPGSIRPKYWMNCLIIPYNSTATPNLTCTHSHKHTETLIHSCAAYPLCYLWDVADKWQHYSSANSKSLARWGVCVCVCLEKRIIEEHGGGGGEHWQDSFSPIGRSKHPADLWIFDRKDCCFNHVAQQTMKNRFFYSCLGTNQVFVRVKSVIWPFIDLSQWSMGTEENNSTWNEERRRQTEKWHQNISVKISVLSN